MSSYFRHIGLFLLAMMLGSGVMTGTAIPRLDSRMTDLAGVLSIADRDDLEGRLRAYESETGNQFVIVIVKSLDGVPITEAALSVAEENGIGRRGQDNGLLLLVALEERKLRFEVGYGLEDRLTDALMSTIIREVLGPAFKEGRYYEGLRAGVENVMAATNGTLLAPEPKKKSKSRGFNGFGLLIFLFFVYLFIKRISRRRGGGGGGGGIWFFTSGLGGFGGSGGGSSGGGWSDFGGGDFGGGGGSFGGGGASGDW